jgi:hypothetical protein
MHVIRWAVLGTTEAHLYSPYSLVLNQNYSLKIHFIHYINIQSTRILFWVHRAFSLINVTPPTKCTLFKYPPDDGFSKNRNICRGFLTILKKPHIGLFKYSAFSWWCDIDSEYPLFAHDMVVFLILITVYIS